MWCYQKPGHEAVILTELQRQQQCSQFCDTLLKAGGVSVPAHSCILSAISPHISSALSTAPAPPAGQSHLLEFRDLGACALLHLVRLLYSGEMVGEGESEKQEAVSAAAKLGIHGLVEVTRPKSRGGGAGQYSEVGVQTEPIRIEEKESRWSEWRKEVRDWMAFLWKETLSNGRKDMWTQTEELPLNPAPPAHSVASYETIDIAAFQSLGQLDSHQLVPITLVYPPKEQQTLQPFSTSLESTEEPTVAGSTSVMAPPCTSAFPSISPYVYSQNPSCDTSFHSCQANSHAVRRDAATAEEWEEEHFEQFQGNIPGFINYFLNPENKESTYREGAGRRQRTRVGGGRRSRARGEQRAGAPRGRGRGGARGRGRLTQMVDVQQVGVGKQQKLFLHRWETRTPRTGQGGGAIGRKLCVKNREGQITAKRQRRRGKVWEVSLNGDVLLCPAGGNTQRGRKKSQSDQSNHPVGRTQRGCVQSTPLSGPNRHFQDIHTVSPSGLSLLSPPVSNVSPASSLVHTISHLPPAPPPQEEQPDSINHLLEEFMTELNILPNDKSLPPTSSNTSAQSKQQGGVTVPESPALPQQCEGELNEILDNFLQSFEQHFERCSVREEDKMNDGSSAEASQDYTALNKSQTTRVKAQAAYTAHLHYEHAPLGVSHSHTSEPRSEARGSLQSDWDAHRSSACSGSKTKMKARKQKTRRKPYLLSRENKVRKARQHMSSDDIELGQNLQLQQVPVVKLSMRSFPPSLTTQHENNCQSLENKRPPKLPTKTNEQQMYWNRKVYPTRSRFREAQITDTAAFLQEPLSGKQSSTSAKATGRRRGRPPKNPRAPAQTQPLDSCGAYRQEDSQTPGNREVETGRTAAPSHTNDVTNAASPAKQLSLQSAEAWSEDQEEIDVTGGSSPVPDPVIISWTDSSEEEEGDEDIDVVGEKTDITKAELGNETHQMEVLSR